MTREKIVVLWVATGVAVLGALILGVTAGYAADAASESGGGAGSLARILAVGPWALAGLSGLLLLAAVFVTSAHARGRHDQARVVGPMLLVVGGAVGMLLFVPLGLLTIVGFAWLIAQALSTRSTKQPT